jgi:hypothetical protein
MGAPLLNVAHLEPECFAQALKPTFFALFLRCIGFSLLIYDV